ALITCWTKSSCAVGHRRARRSPASQDATSNDRGYEVSENLVSYPFILKDGRTDFCTFSDSPTPALPFAENPPSGVPSAVEETT
ncbi:MAG TPA: hypothetical protein VNO55_16710, partial [Polyangia bacterium]|nr:hypothetical protein [Polyangia bacterium]